jgi:hypothetical protein
LKLTHGYYFDAEMRQRNLSDKIAGIEACYDCVNAFESLSLTEDKAIRLLTIAYIISREGCIKEVFNSLVISAATTFTDKVKGKIEGDISKSRIFLPHPGTLRCTNTTCSGIISGHRRYMLWFTPAP